MYIATKKNCYSSALQPKQPSKQVKMKKSQGVQYKNIVGANHFYTGLKLYEKGQRREARVHFEIASTLNHADAYCYLAKMAHPKQLEERIQLYSQAGELEHAEALYKLGELYEEKQMQADNSHGQQSIFFTASETIGEPTLEAISCYERAGELNHKDAYARLDYLYRSGCYGLEVDEEKANTYRSKAAKLGHVRSLLSLGGLCSAQKAIEYYSQAAENGSIQALFNLADIYKTGIGVDCDIYKALDYYCKANKPFHKKYRLIGEPLDRDMQETQVGKEMVDLLNDLDRDGGVLGIKQTHEKEIDRCIAELEQEAAEDYYAAEYALGVIYENGRGGIEVDMDKAIGHYERALKTGHRDAAYTLGFIFQMGKGVPVDIEKAFSYYEKGGVLICMDE
jgi:TPR repeat protein